MTRTVHAAAGTHAATVARTHAVAGFILIHDRLLLGRQSLVKFGACGGNLLEHVGANLHVLGTQIHGFGARGRTLAAVGFVPGEVLGRNLLTACDVLVEGVFGGARKLHALSQFRVVVCHLLCARSRVGCKSRAGKSGNNCECCYCKCRLGRHILTSSWE